MVLLTDVKYEWRLFNVVNKIKKDNHVCQSLFRKIQNTASFIFHVLLLTHRHRRWSRRHNNPVIQPDQR